MKDAAEAAGLEQRSGRLCASVRRSPIEGPSTAVDGHGVEESRERDTGEKRAQRHAACDEKRSGQIHQHGRRGTAEGQCKIQRGPERQVTR